MAGKRGTVRRVEADVWTGRPVEIVEHGTVVEKVDAFTGKPKQVLRVAAMKKNFWTGTVQPQTDARGHQVYTEIEIG